MNRTSLVIYSEVKIPTSDDPQSLLHLMGRYLEYLRVRNFSEMTVWHRNHLLRYFRLFCEQLGLTQARQVTRAVILNYQSYLFHYRKEGGAALTVGTQKHRLGAVSSFFSYLTREGLALYNPASDLEMPRKEVRLPKSILSVADVEAILNVPDVGTAMGMRDRAILEVLYSTGIRRMELCCLDRNHLDFDRGMLRVEQGKGHKDRYVPIGERALKWVEKYLVEVRPRLCPSLNETALFLSAQGERIRPVRIGVHVHEIVERAGLGKSGSCHLFRHAFATALLEAGCDIRHIQAMLGHSSLESTQVYTHLNMRALKEVHQRYHPARLPKAAGES